MTPIVSLTFITLALAASTAAQAQIDGAKLYDGDRFVWLRDASSNASGLS